MYDIDGSTDTEVKLKELLAAVLTNLAESAFAQRFANLVLAHALDLRRQGERSTMKCGECFATHSPAPGAVHGGL